MTHLHNDADGFLRKRNKNNTPNYFCSKTLLILVSFSLIISKAQGTITGSVVGWHCRCL